MTYTNNEAKELFNSISLSCLSNLESNDEFDSLNFHYNEGLKSHQFVVWEKKNIPYKLPEDFRMFYSLFNGLSAPWKVQIGAKSIEIGKFSLNKIEDLKRISVEGIFPSNDDHHLSQSTSQKNSGFIIDSCEVGDIILLYPRETDDQILNSIDLMTTLSPLKKQHAANSIIPSVWLVDLSLRWHYISANFSDYMRLMYAHMGVHGWQQTFTPEGLSEITTQWMNIFCKSRLCVDLYHESKINTIDTKQNRQNLQKTR